MITWSEDEDGDTIGVGPNGEYVSLWAPTPYEGWRVLISESEPKADEGYYIVAFDLPSGWSLEEVKEMALNNLQVYLDTLCQTVK